MPFDDQLDTENNRKIVRQFLVQKGIAHYRLDPEKLLSDYLEEMQFGLQKRDTSSSLKMIPTYVSSDKEFLRDHAALALDAGGTNLRCALVTMPSSGKPILEYFCKRQMPALSQELSAADFFAEIAEFMQPVIEEYYHRYQKGPECLGFCFSYATQIVMQENGDLDGKLLQWSKEVKVPELVGQFIGSSLLKVLAQKFGAKAPCHVYIVNDTVSTLLAGQSAADDATYTDFIGYILGTGINSCYAESREQIADLDLLYTGTRTIVNVESGNYNRFPQSTIDASYDALTQNSGAYLQEKSCSGRYWGELVSFVLRSAATAGILPIELAELPLQDSVSINAILHHPSKPQRDGLTSWGSPFVAWLDEHQVDNNARERIYFFTEAMLERSALFTSINMLACIMRSCGGHSPLHPICLTVDGSTFYALHRFEHRVRSWLDFMLSEEKQRKRYYRIKTVENAPLLGAAIAALGFGSR